MELTPEGGENRVARLQLSVTEVFKSFVSANLFFCSGVFVFLSELLFQMFGLIFQVSKFETFV